MNIEKQLYALAKNSGINYDLGHIVEALSLLKNPHRGISYIHIAGTNGKGTTADFIAQSLEASGKNVGLYSSPHLFSYTERFQVNGNQITLEQINSYLKIIKAKIKQIPLTEFEILTLIAFLFFKDANPDFVVMETGLGGRLDATNVVDPILTVITTIAFDHQAILGNTLEQIATEKLGIMKPTVPMVTFEHEPKISKLFQEKANQLKCPLFFVKQINENYLLNNNLLADKAISLLGYSPQPTGKTRLTGRMQVLSQAPFKLADSAHNQEGIRKLVHYIKTHNLETDVIFSVSQKPKEDILEMAQMLSSVALTLYITEFDFYKAMPLSEIIKITKDIKNLKVLPKNQTDEFIRTTKNNLIITGSIYFLGSVLKHTP